MNRLSPLIVRRSAIGASGLDRPRAGAASANWQAASFDGDAGEWLDQLKLFATGWIGGLIFFGTYLS